MAMGAKTGGESKMPAIAHSPSSFAARVERLLDHVRYRRAETEADLDSILRLRYKAYLKEGGISPNSSGRLNDGFDEGDNVYNFGVFIDGELASALRLHTLLEPGQRSPVLSVFGDVLVPQLEAGKLMLDPNRFVTDYKVARWYPELPYVTLRIAYMAALFFSADLVTIMARPEHRAFYKRGLFAKEVYPPRIFPPLIKPVALLLVDFAKDAELAAQRYFYAASSQADREALFGKGSTSAHFRSAPIAIASTSQA